MSKNVILIILLTVLILSACSPDDIAFDKLPFIKEQEILFTDDFSDPRSGWATGESDTILKKYSPEGFWLIINSENTKAWSVPGMNFSDVQVEVTARKVTGSDNNAIGLFCRYQDASNHYRFVISSDGYYGISKTVNGIEEILGSNAMDYSFDINQGDRENRISAECTGSQLKLSVNDIQLMTVEDESLTYGDAGIMAENREGVNLAVLFNDFLITKR